MAHTRKSRFTPGDFSLRVGRSHSGLGLFAEEVIPRDACIIEYTGQEISPAEQIASRSRYLFEISRTKTIDGRARSNRARYINHACAPNCEIEIRRGRVFVMARRRIRAGEELSYDYGKEYFDEYIKPGGCRCAACAKKFSQTS